MFLQLLVTQIQNQDPLNPDDSMQFVSQLAQFTELEQVIAIRGDIESQISASGTTTSATSGTTTSGSDSTSGTGSTGSTNNSSGTSGGSTN
jgi:flagellar basal-body rod modification protein FlgD